MKTNVVEKSQWGRELQVEVEADRIESELAKAYKDYQKRVEIPGFRKGKVPLRVIKARYGESIRDRVVYDLLPGLVEEATREAGLVAAAPPTIDELDAEPGQDLKFTARLDIWPQIDVQNYEDLAVSRPVHTVTDEEVGEQLEELRRRQGTERSVERPLQNGDVLIADLQRLDDSGLPIVGEKFEERRLVLGEENAPSPEFEQALLGIEPGGERDVRFSYREDLPDENLAGSSDHFKVTVREIHELSLPELDDEFAKDVGEQFDSLDALKEHIRIQLQQQWDQMARQRVRSQLIQRLMAANPFDLPESLVRNYVRNMREHQRESQDDRSQAVPEGEPTEDERRLAEQRLRTHLLIDGLREKMDVQLTDEEFETALQERADAIGIRVEDLKRSARVDDLRREQEENRIFELLIEKARITDETA